MPSISRRSLFAGLALLGVGAVVWQRNQSLNRDQIATHYSDPLAPPMDRLNVYHLGHSLVGRDMPAMLAQLAGHTYDSQLGWGTSLRDHWEPDVAINGFAQENDHARYRVARQAIGSDDYDAVILTEMVEIADAIRYHDSPDYLAKWADLARQASPKTRVYLYESWHHTDDGNGWLARIDRDWDTYWLEQVVYPAVIQTDLPIHLIPAGQVMAAVVRDGILKRDELFSKHADGTSDTIHFNDIGAYLVALTHFAVLYHTNPEGLPHQLKRADGTVANAPRADVAKRMQQIVWDVVRRYRETGVAP